MRVLRVSTRGGRSAARWMLALLAVAAGQIGLPQSLPAADYFLTIGGGYNPTGNQVSLEKNVHFLQNVLAEKRPDRPKHEIYFADGDDSERDVQAARNAGMIPLVAGFGYLAEGEDPGAWLPEAVFSRPEELIDWLEVA